MAFLQRYSNIKNGGISFIGNTLGLSKAANANTAGLLGSVGAFTSLDLSLKVNDFPAGTTLDYTKNGSAAPLALPSGSTVLYAELIWGGLYRSAARDISSLTGNAVRFGTPQGTFSVSPDQLTKRDFLVTNNGVTIGFYVRSANVTSLVQSGMNGSYSLSSVPALLETLDSLTLETNHAGWTLAVIYENAALPLRNLTLWGGGAVVSLAAGSTDVFLTGFLTPETLPVSGKMFVSAQEGDAVIAGDKMLFGQNVLSLQTLSGPNNPANNFFASQINGANGTLETGGTFGGRNANASAGTNTIACRQGWDITAADVSSLLSAGMMTAAVRFTTTGDLYVANGLALQIDSKGAQLRVVKSADKTYAAVGDIVSFTLNVTNTGSLAADTVVLSDSLPAELSLVPGSVSVNGAPYAGGLPVSIGPLAAGASAVVAFSAKVNVLPAVNPVVNTARADYTFSPFPGYTVASSSSSNRTELTVFSVRLSLVKAVDKAIAAAGETLTYTSVASNQGNLTLQDLIFRDPPPAGTSFVIGSVTVNGISYPAYDPAAGFTLPPLFPGQSSTISFQVKIQ